MYYVQICCNIVGGCIKKIQTNTFLLIYLLIINGFIRLFHPVVEDIFIVIFPLKNQFSKKKNGVIRLSHRNFNWL